MNTKTVGEISEAVVLSRLIELGYAVSIPFGDNQRYDFIVDDGQTLLRAQVKTGRFIKGAVVFNTCSSNPFTNKRTDYRGSADIFLVYSPDTKEVYNVPVSECAKTESKLRVDAPKQNSSRIRWAKDFILE